MTAATDTGPAGNFPTGDWDRDIQAISDWLVAESLERVDLPRLLAGFCDSLNAAGLPILRAISAMNTLHPMYLAQTFTYIRGEENITTDIPHGAQNTGEWQRSPLKPLIDEGRAECRYDVTDTRLFRTFPVLSEVHAMGGTDYFGLLTRFDRRADEIDQVERLDGLLTSWVTDRQGGYDGKHVQALRRLVPRFAVAAKMAKREETTRNIVTAYMGRDAGFRVLNGQIKLGDGELLPSVIWYSDMRNSTSLCETLSPEDYLSALNHYFACSAGAVMEGGGEVLRFVGDAVLGIFPVGDGADSPKDACAKALAAAGDARGRLAAVNGDRRDVGQPALDFGLGLHLGEVMYGNIGVPARVEFSVTGPAANEAARLEDLTKETGEPVLVSKAFTRHLTVPWRALGSYRMRGVAETQEVFAPPAAR